jgi:photosystem II stability/assembly factor-like uncharacterized protein
MSRHRAILLIFAFAAFQFQASSQLITWESLDGPYRGESRTHIRYADGDRRYFGSVTGTFRTTDGGTSWVPLASPPALALRVYLTGAGTHIAVCDTANGTGKPDHGISQVSCTSTDRGEHWISHGMSRIFGLAFAGGDTVYKYSGVADAISGATSASRSTDAGATWTTMLTPYLNWGVNDLYTQGNNVFAHFDGFDIVSYVKRSTDGGTNWQTIDADQLVFTPPNKLIRRRRDYSGTFSINAYIELSTDNGSTWSSKVTADSGFTSLVTNGTGALLVLRKPGYQVYRSTNGGTNWSHASDGAAGDPFLSLRFYGKTYLVGTTQGNAYYRSSDYGTSWALINDIDATPLSGLVQPASDSLFVVADDRGGWIESTDAGGTWSAYTSPFDKAPVSCLLSIPSGSLFVGTPYGFQRKRGDEEWRSGSISGPVWDMTYRSGPLFLAGNGRHGIYPLEFNGSVNALDTSITHSTLGWTYGGGITYLSTQPDYYSLLSISDSLILAGWGNRIARSTNRGTSWSVEKTSGKHFVAIVADSSSAHWAANDSTGIFKSTDKGATWTASNTGLANLHVLTMTVARNGYLLAGTPVGVYRSTDGGASWSSVGLSSFSIQNLETGASARVYAGTQDGFYLSTNSGSTWAEYSTGLDDTDIRSVVYAPDGSVYCGTAHEGVYRMNEIPIGIPITIRPLNAATHIPRPVRISWHPVAEATGYDLLVSTSSLFPRIGTWDTTLTGARDTLVAVPGLAAETKYYWKVRARALTGYGSYSKYRYFTTSAITPGFEVVLISPHDNIVIKGDTVKCLWHRPLLKTKKYWMDYSLDSTFAGASTDSTITDTTASIRLLLVGRTYFWRVRAHTGTEWADFSDVFSFSTRLTGVGDSRDLPTSFALEQNYPNPFNPTTVISAQWPVASHVRIAVYDILGREVTLLMEEWKEPGRYQVTWDGRNAASGVYLCRMTAGSFVATERMLLLK